MTEQQLASKKRMARTSLLQKSEMNVIRGERLINSAIAGFYEIYLGRGALFIYNCVEPQII